jgi:phage-related protein
MEARELMNVTINDLVVGEGTDYKISAIEGLGKPPVRTSSQNYSGRHGGRVNGQFYGPRLITISGFFKHGTCDDHEAARDALNDALPIGEDLETIIERFSGTEGRLTTRVLDLQMPLLTGGKQSDYKIDLFAGDPNFYLGDEIELTIPRFVGGGVVLPVILPATLAAGSGITTANNDGTAVVYPVITITGSATNPKITKFSTGEKVEVSLTMSGGDELVIDLKNHTITLNGGSVLNLRTSDSDWFGLDIGANPMLYETTNGSDSGTAVMKWRNATTSM